MKKINSEGVCPFELKETINIFPIKKIITVCKVAILSDYVKIKPIKSGQTALCFCSSLCVEIFNDYIKSKHITIGHPSFHNNYQYIINKPFTARVESLLPKNSNMVFIIIEGVIVEGMDFKVKEDLSADLPFEDQYTSQVIDDTVITNYMESLR